MQKSIPTIFITIILSAMVSAKGNYIKHLDKEVTYVVPSEDYYSECDEFSEDIAKRAAQEAQSKKSLNKDFKNLNLDNFVCKHTYNKYDWFKLTFTHEGETCTIFVIASWTPWVLQRQFERYALEAKHTLRANQEFGKCEVETPSAGKIHIDEEAEELSNDDEVVEEVHFGPGNMVLPLHPRKEEEAPQVKHNLVEEEVEELPQTPLMGGWRDCDESEKKKVPGVFAQLMAQDKIKGLHVYTQNVSECKAQLVNGLNYNVVLSFNSKKCRLAFDEEFTGPVSLFEGAPSVGDFKECVEVFANN